jgi:hypothetical protein
MSNSKSTNILYQVHVGHEGAAMSKDICQGDRLRTREFQSPASPCDLRGSHLELPMILSYDCSQSLQVQDEAVF